VISRAPETRSVVRLLSGIQFRGVATALCVAVFAVFIYLDITSLRPDLQHPASIGTDISNYYAAGQRLNDGHQLYALEPGDRAIANGTGRSMWSYPLLSPPPIAVLWRPLAMLPGDFSMYLWWWTGALGSIAFAAWLIVRSNTRIKVLALLLAPSLSITLWSGNVNALLIPLGAVLWWAESRGKSNLAGFIVGLSMLLKLVPGMFLFWLIFIGDRRGVRAFFATVAFGLALSVLGAGLDAHFKYLDVASQANAVGLSGLSPVSIARSMGIGSPFAEWAPYAIAAVCAAEAWLMRKRPDWCFAACAAGLALGTPDLRIETLAWLLVAMVPFATGRGNESAEGPAPLASPEAGPQAALSSTA